MCNFIKKDEEIYYVFSLLCSSRSLSNVLGRGRGEGGDSTCEMTSSGSGVTVEVDVWAVKFDVGAMEVDVRCCLPYVDGTPRPR